MYIGVIYDVNFIRYKLSLIIKIKIIKIKVNNKEKYIVINESNFWNLFL